MKEKCFCGRFLQIYEARITMNIASGGVVATAHNDITIYCP